MEVVPFQEQLDPALRLGEGRSRTSAEKSMLFELKIWLPGQGAMRDLVRAESLRQAITFATNRYPNCKVEVPDQVVKKPKLVRSKRGPKEKARQNLRIVEAKRAQNRDG
jgi:hypothetical protein